MIFSSESPNYASATHAAEFVQGAVPLGITRISWGTITKLRCPICSQKALGFRNTCFYCAINSFAKIRSSLADLLMCQFTHLHKSSDTNSLKRFKQLIANLLSRLLIYINQPAPTPSAHYYKQTHPPARGIHQPRALKSQSPSARHRSPGAPP